MNWWHPQNFAQKKANLQTRMQVIKAIRRFFDDQGFWEVETPTLQIMPCADMHIHGFKTEYFGPDLKKRRDYYLHTSPEFEMKKLLVAGVPKLYQICKVFRNSENTKLHSPEFTMLEWYRTGKDYEDIMEDCESLIRSIAQVTGTKELRFQGKVCDPHSSFERLSVVEAFQIHAGIDLDACLDDTVAFAAAARGQGIRVIDSDQWDDIFHAIMAEKIEPYLGQDAATILYGYPASMACLSKKAKDSRYAERLNFIYVVLISPMRLRS